MSDADGPSAFVNIDFGNLPSIHNVESIEIEMPLVIESCTLRIDGGGPGKFRGGVGMVRRVRLLDDEGQYSVLSDRAVIPPWGVIKGGSGKPYHLSLERDGNQSDFATPGKVTGHPIFQNDVVVIRSSGGGGYGDPLERDTAHVASDIDYGYVSVEAAKSVYGVVLKQDGSIDDAATLKQRATLASNRHYLRFRNDDAVEPYVGAKGKRRILTLDPNDATALGVSSNDLVEMYGRHPAPLRAWVRLAPGKPGEIPMDDFGRRVLGVKEGDSIMVRFVPTPILEKGYA